VKKAGLVVAGCVVLGACALKGDVRRVEQQLMDFRAETARADSARAVMLDRMLQEIIASQEGTLDSLSELQRRLLTFQGDTRTDLTEVQRQLVQIQELTGQSQQRLSELRGQLQQRAAQPMIAVTPSGDTVAAPGNAGGEIGAQELYDLSLQQLRRNSPLTAREGFRKLIADFPLNPLVAEAQYYIGETFEAEPDSAAAAYERVVREHPDAPHAPTAMFKLGLLAERRGDLDAAKVYFSRVIAAYPQSDEAELARTKINSNP
jgi:tol-pal system protein YbgF